MNDSPEAFLTHKKIKLTMTPNFAELLEIDDDDKKIIELLEANSDITDAEIAKKLEKSVDAIGVRILKLERTGLIKSITGLNIKRGGIKVVMVYMLTKNVDQFIKKVKACPFMNHVFKISGEFNIVVMISASNLRTIEKIMDVCFRQDPNVADIRSAMVIESIHNFIVPIDFSVERFNESYCASRNTCLINDPSLHKFQFDN